MNLNSVGISFQNSMNDFYKASNDVQKSFQMNKDDTNTKNMAQSMVEEDVTSKFAQAQLNVLKTQDEVQQTILDIYA